MPMVGSGFSRVEFHVETGRNRTSIIFKDNLNVLNRVSQCCLGCSTSYPTLKNYVEKSLFTV
jgi:Fe-S cluster biogenesis protein NfuA